MNRRGYQQYKQQSVNSMTAGELLLLLCDELVKRGTMASIALEKENYPAFEAAIDRCIDIVKYLDETLDRKYPIARELSPLYEFFTHQMSQIKKYRNKEELERLRGMFSDLREAFQGAEKLSSQGKQESRPKNE